MKAVLTGASGAIGRSIFAALSELGFDVACCSRSTPDPLRQLIDAGNAGGANHVSIPLDLEQDDSIAQCARAVEQWCERRLDALVNCAGVAHGGLANMTRAEDLRRTFQVNFFGPILLTQRLSRLMSRSGGGKIVNIASHAGLRADRGTLAYGTSKAALIHATRILAAEYARDKITVNAVAPSVVDGGMGHKMDPKAVSRIVEQTNVGRTLTPGEVADVVRFLLRDAPSALTGEVLRVDGSISL